MEFQLCNLSLSDAPLLQELAANAVIDDMNTSSSKVSIDRLVSGLTFVKDAIISSNELFQECAAAVMSKLASTSARAVLIETGCLPLLLGTLQSCSVDKLISSHSTCKIVVHAAGAIQSLLEHDDTWSAAAGTAGIASALVDVLASSVSIGIDFNCRISALWIERLANAVGPTPGSVWDEVDACSFVSEANAKLQIAVATRLHALVENSAHRQALVAAGGVKRLVAALNSSHLVSDAGELTERALFELAKDPAVAAAVIDCGGIEYYMHKLAALDDLTTQQVSMMHDEDLDRDAWPEVWDELEWSADEPTIWLGVMATQVLNVLSTFPQGRVRLAHSSCALQVIGRVFNYGRDLDGEPSDKIFDHLALVMFKLSQGQESRDAVRELQGGWLPFFLRRMIDAGMNEQEVEQRLRDRGL